LGAVATLISVPLAVAAATPAPAAQLGQYNISAAGQGALVEIDAPNFLVVESAELAVPAAQAAVSSVTGSNGFASVPYPGQDIVALPGTANGLTGIPLPSYPLYVGTSYPSKLVAKAVGPVYSMHSQSSQLASTANGSGGASAGPLNLGSLKAAATAHETANGTAIATANSDVFGIDVAGVLRIGEVHATASAKQTKSGKLVRTSSLDVGQTTIAGVGIDLTPQGLTIGSAHLPVSADNPLAKVLRNADIGLQYVAPRRTRTGIISAGVAVTVKHTFPKSFPDLGGVTTTLTILLGSASAAAETTGVPALPLGTGPGGTPGSTGSVEPTTGSVGPATGSVGDGGSGVPIPSTPTGSSDPAPSFAGETPVVSSNTRTMPVAQTSPFGVRGLYLYLVLAGAVILLGGTLWRLLGVRILWT
jgi:hypothetical protein